MFLSWTDHTCTPSLPGSPISIYLLINSSTVRVLPIIFNLFFSFVFLLDGHFMIPFYPGAHKHYVAPQSTKMSLESPFFFFFPVCFSFHCSNPGTFLRHRSYICHPQCDPALYSTVSVLTSTRIREYPHTLNPKTTHVLLKTMVSHHLHFNFKYHQWYPPTDALV